MKTYMYIRIVEADNENKAHIAMCDPDGEPIHHALETMLVELTPEIEAKIWLEYLRSEIRAERISYGEIAKLQSLAEYIKPDDVELLGWIERNINN